MRHLKVTDEELRVLEALVGRISVNNTMDLRGLYARITAKLVGNWDSKPNVRVVDFDNNYFTLRVDP